ncbi:MAG: serine/threonine-protein kinase, partial [Myxococcota bacterium]|nr:serine/threonine-protein kinase [Myxococcota bacterium]
LMSPDLVRNHILAARFLVEAQVTSQLQHPHIVPIHAIERDADTGSLAYTMKHIEGLNLTAILAEAHAQRNRPGPVDPAFQVDTLVEHFITCCDAIAYAHSKGVLHRDIKPSNIMIGPHREVYVMDWGLAKVLDAPEMDTVVEIDRDDEDKTRVGAIMGTLRYMSPEQGQGLSEVIGPASDQFALGLILYEIVCGQTARPMLKTDDLLVWAAQGRTRPIMPRPPLPPLAPELRAILQKVLQAHPEDRYADVGELAADLRRYRANLAVLARPDTTAQRIRRWLSHHRAATLNALVALTALVAVVVAGAVAKTYHDAEVAAEREATLTDFLTRAGRMAGRVDAHFAAIESRLEGVTASAASLLEYAQPTTDPIYRTETFGDPERGPPDAVKTANYLGKSVHMSTHWPDVALAPGVALATVEPALRALMPIRHVMRRAHLSARVEYGAPDDPAAEA